ncbi:MAG: hypothetical protein ACO307_08070, partial [Ilumatobacteraceae bacterium]
LEPADRAGLEAAGDLHTAEVDGSSVAVDGDEDHDAARSGELLEFGDQCGPGRSDHVADLGPAE